MHTVIVVDDHPFVRASVKAFLSQNNFNVIAETGSGQEAIQMTRELSPDLVVLDICIPKLDGFEVINRLRAFNPRVKILILSSQSPEQFSARCKNAGASGFVCKNKQLSDFLKATRAVMSGYSYFPDMAFSSVLALEADASEKKRLSTLSEREMMVLQHLASGWSNIEIGEALFLSNKTISTHKSRLLQKLELTSVVELVDLAKRNSLI